MALMKSVRLDIDAIAIGANTDESILAFLQDMCAAAATNHRLPEHKRDLAIALSRAVSEAKVHQYDDRFGGPVFYIP